MWHGDIKMDRNRIDKIAQTPEDRLLLAKIWDKIHAGITRNIPVSTPFLSLRELELGRYLLGQQDGLYAFGGYETAERKMLVYLPDYLSEEYLYSSDSPIVCLRAAFYEGDSPGHRDFLGALMGAGIARETVGDICIGNGSCDFFVTAEIAQYLLQNLSSAGRTKLKLTAVPIASAQIPEPEVAEIRDTVSSLRLDSILAAGFRMGRASASQQILSGKAAIDGLPCEKPDKPVAEGAVITLRGSGKIKLQTVHGQTKKGRLSVTIHRYL